MKSIATLGGVVAAVFMFGCGEPDSGPKPKPEPQLTKTSDPLAASAGVDGAAIFARDCAGCHGKTGDGDGETPTERPPRAFSKGGFAFGNTRDQLFKTISKGMPGRSDMQPFEDRLSEAERWAVVDHLLTLVPKDEVDYGAGAELRVEGEALVVRGKLQKIEDGLPEHPRGLLIALPGGASFEYRVDDVRLLALREGGFVRRKDWMNRGGDPLEPLGTVFAKEGNGNPEATFVGDGNPLSAQLLATATRGPEVELSYRLSDPRGAIRVVERLRAEGAVAVLRQITLEAAPDGDWPRLRLDPAWQVVSGARSSGDGLLRIEGEPSKPAVVKLRHARPTPGDDR
ncbi:MAG: cytochrome c [Salinibacterium sp.]|nr:cytochrome c [Salinibacterium sp.]